MNVSNHATSPSPQQRSYGDVKYTLVITAVALSAIGALVVSGLILQTHSLLGYLLLAGGGIGVSIELIMVVIKETRGPSVAGNTHPVNNPQSQPVVGNTHPVNNPQSQPDVTENRAAQRYEERRQMLRWLHRDSDDGEEELLTD